MIQLSERPFSIETKEDIGGWEFFGVSIKEREINTNNVQAARFRSAGPIGGEQGGLDFGGFELRILNREGLAELYLVKWQDLPEVVDRLRVQCNCFEWLASNHEVTSTVTSNPASSIRRLRNPFEDENPENHGAESLPKATRRELEILTLSATGTPSQAIADALFISKRTVDFHFANLFRKWGVKRRIQALKLARERGLLLA